MSAVENVNTKPTDFSSSTIKNTNTENDRREHNLQLALRLAEVLAIHPCKDKQALAKRHTKLDEEIDRAEVIRELKEACARRGDEFRMPFQIGSSRELETIQRWANECPDFVPAVPGGAGNFLLVVDCDRAKKSGDVDGLEYFKSLAAGHGFDLRTVPATITQSGGRHFFFANPDRHTCAAPGFADKNIQLRGEDGYVIAPGAIRADGKCYAAAEGHPDLLECAAYPDFMVEAPQWLLEAAGARKRSEKGAQSVSVHFNPDDTSIKDRVKHELAQRLPKQLSEGVRRQSVLRAAFIAGDLGLYEDQAIEAIEAWYAAHSNSECPEAIDAIVHRAFNSRVNEIGCSFTPNWSLAGNIGSVDDPDETDAETDEERRRTPGKKKRAFSFAPLSEIIAEPLNNSAPPLIEGLISLGDLGVLYGDSNVGKSFLCLNLALHIATGRDWCGRQVERAAVAYVAAENPSSIKRRARAWVLANEASHDTPFYASRGAFDAVADAERVIKMIKQTEHETGVSFGLVVIDTLARSMAGDENSSAVMGALIGACDRVIAATGCALLLVHHTGKDAAKGARGWSGLRAAVDVEIRVTKESAGRYAEVVKLRDGETGAFFGFDLRDIELGRDARGNVIKTAVAQCRELGKTSPAPVARKAPSPRAQFCLDALRLLTCKRRGTIAPGEADDDPNDNWRIEIPWSEVITLASEQRRSTGGAALTTRESNHLRSELIDRRWIVDCRLDAVALAD